MRLLCCCINIICCCCCRICRMHLGNHVKICDNSNTATQRQQRSDSNNWRTWQWHNLCKMHLNMHKTFLSLLHEISNLFLRPSHELWVIVGKAKRKFIAARSCRCSSCCCCCCCNCYLWYFSASQCQNSYVSYLGNRGLNCTPVGLGLLRTETDYLQIGLCFQRIWSRKSF